MYVYATLLKLFLLTNLRETFNQFDTLGHFYMIGYAKLGVTNNPYIANPILLYLSNASYFARPLLTSLRQNLPF